MHFREDRGKKLVWLNYVIFLTQDSFKNCEILRNLTTQGMSTTLRST